MTYSVHPQGICESRQIGEGTRIWAFAHVLPGAKIGRDCNICDHVFIENDVVLGDRVTVKCGVQLWDGLRIARRRVHRSQCHVYQRQVPRSKQYQKQFCKRVVGRGASIGANATILPGSPSAPGRWSGRVASSRGTCPPTRSSLEIPGAFRATWTSKKGSLPLLASSARCRPRLPAVQELRVRRDASQPQARRRHARHVSGRRVRGRSSLYTQAIFSGVRRSQQARPRRARASRLPPIPDMRQGRSRHSGRQRPRAPRVAAERPSLGLHVPPMVWCTQYKYSETRCCSCLPRRNMTRPTISATMANSCAWFHRRRITILATFCRVRPSVGGSDANFGQQCRFATRGA